MVIFHFLSNLASSHHLVISGAVPSVCLCASATSHSAVFLSPWWLLLSLPNGFLFLFLFHKCEFALYPFPFPLPIYLFLSNFIITCSLNDHLYMLMSYILGASNLYCLLDIPVFMAYKHLELNMPQTEFIIFPISKTDSFFYIFYPCR